MSEAIEMRDVFYRAGPGFAVDDLTLAVPSGSIFGFLGPNGSGKTTTIRLLLGHLRAQRGTIRVLGLPVPREAPRVLARVGYVPERAHLYRSLSVEEAMRYHAAFFPTWDARLSVDLRTAFALDGRSKVAHLSKGELGKLLMLLALSSRPELLVLDEPTDGLDPRARRDVLEALVEVAARASVTVFISSHLVHELERICDRIAILNHGKLIVNLPIGTLKSGVKRLRVAGARRTISESPFAIVSREPESVGDGETWLVHGWAEEHREWFGPAGITLREVIDLDLEEGFLALLGSRPAIASILSARAGDERRSA